MDTQGEGSKREAMLVAACDCFSQKGFSASRIADIAHRAGVGKGTVYEYFRSKEDLLLDACLFDCERLEKMMNQLTPGVPVSLQASQRAHNHLHPVSQGFVVLRSVLTVLLTHSQNLNRMASDLAFACKDRPDLLTRAQTTLGSKWQEWMQRAWELGMAGMDSNAYRRISAEDYRWAARLIVAAVDGLIWQYQFLPDTEGPEHLAHHIAAAWIRMHLHNPADLDRYIPDSPPTMEDQ
ncbi:MAG: TetR/AcrR family transcriptional regulator [Planctomycetota bacterium]|nr:MAG: TetR/AcrR family transcriptional regulator [Planctomycetota bacterium]